MVPLFKTLLAANDAIHDLAVLVYAGTGFAMWAGARQAGSRPGSRLLPRLAKISLFIFILAGMPRMLTYHGFEWQSAVNNGRAGALLLKLAIFCLAAGLGTFAWIKAGKRKV